MSTKIERYDIWTEAEDDLLATCVLDNVAVRKTQLDAFARAGKELGRTSDACGYRWNAILRKQYKKQLQKAFDDSVKLKDKVRRNKKTEPSKDKPKKATPKTGNKRKEYEHQAKQYAKEQQKAVEKAVSRISPVIEVKEYTIRLTKQEMYALGNGSVPQDLKAEINKHLSK